MNPPDPLFFLKNSKIYKKKGTGLGLPIVKKIVEDHGGGIRITDSRWGGTLVEIQLPLRNTAFPG